MLSSSSSQYLHPDYLQPLPTTLDAKKSPLALLAQTCSSIGKDSSSASSAKSLIPPIERKDASKDKDAPSSRPKSGADTPRVKSRDASERKAPLTPPAKKTSSPAPKDLSKRSTTPASKSPCHSPSKTESRSECRSRDNAGHAATTASSSDAVESKPLSATHPISSSQRPDAALASSLYSSFGLPYPGYPYPLLGHPLGLDAAAAAAAAAHQGLGKHGALGWPGLSPYAAGSVGYSRSKPSPGSSSLVSACKDPSCNHCQNGVHSGQSPCATGCSQYSQDKTPTSLAHTAALGGLPLYPGALGATPSLHALSSLYAAGNPYAAMLPGAAQGLPPFVCNWAAGSDYCGKRFATSEELLQHLRTHTSASDSALSMAGLPYGGLGMFPGLPSHLPPPSHGSLSPDSALRQASHYPRSMSPSSLLAASRYHPYKSALSSLASPQSAAGLPPFYSPLALYGQRLGAAAP